MEPTLRIARPEDALAVRSLLDAALLDVDAIEVRIEVGDVLVATVEGTVVGVLVCETHADAAHITGIAVRKRRRDNGIGTALVRDAVERYERVTATFDERVVPFYESLGFDIEPADGDGRRRGVVESATNC